MSAHPWFVHIQGETFGPLSNEIVVLMLRQNRLQFSDFIWTDGYGTWTRISEVDDFAELMPQYPKVPIPNSSDVKVTGFELPREAVREIAKPAAPVQAAAPAPAEKTGAGAAKKARVRRFPRVEIEGRFITADYGSFDVHNISEGGLYVKSSTILLPIGTNLIFKLETPVFPHIFDLCGVVVRFGSANDPAGFAIEFTKISNEQKKMIREFTHPKA